MEHGMVTTQFPQFVASSLYVIFGLVLVGLVIWLHQRDSTEH